jgi:hypothetical protein
MTGIAQSGGSIGPRGLRREIALVLTAKALALALLYGLCFGPAHQTHADASSVATSILGPSSPSHGMR